MIRGFLSSSTGRVMSSVRYALKIGALRKRSVFVREYLNSQKYLQESDFIFSRSTMCLKHFCSGATMRTSSRSTVHLPLTDLELTVSLLCKYINYATKVCEINLFRYVNVEGSTLQLVQIEYDCDWPKEDSNSKYYEVEEEAIRRPASDPLKPRMGCPEDGMVTQDEQELTSIEVGDTINLPELLFTEKRDYLVKYNSDQKVKAEQLLGKVIVILFVSPYHDHFLDEKETITSLKDIYNDLHCKGGFEVVSVAIDDHDRIFNKELSINSRLGDKSFENMFSVMPWCAIPFSDETSRKHLKRRFGVTGHFPSSFVVDSKGMVSTWGACFEFQKYGTLGYPFSRERILSLISEDIEAAVHPSLQTLLGSPERDYLISNKGDQVPIHTLQDKVVALYFYEADVTDDYLTIELETAYKELAIKKEKFEVVLLYLYDTHYTFDCTNKESFSEKFKTMPWLALPFKDPNHKKLKRIFCYPSDIDSSVKVPTIVMFGPHGEFVDPCGDDIVRDFELAAYPFTRKKVAKLHTEKMKELKLEMLWDQNTVFRRKDGSQVRISQLAGRRVITLFQEVNPFPDLEMLGDSYLDMKGTDDEFEVIHVSSRKSEFDYDLPWVVHYFGDGYSLTKELLSCVFGFHHCLKKKSGTSLLAFDQDGSLVRRKLFPTREDMDSPFRAGCLEKDTWDQLNDVYRWYMWDDISCSCCGSIYEGKF